MTAAMSVGVMLGLALMGFLSHFIDCNDNAMLNLTGIDDPGVVELVKDYHRLCPYSSTYSAVTFEPGFTLGLLKFEDRFRQVCCGSCEFCDHGGNCCPDAISSVLTEAELSENPVLTACVYPQLRPYHPDKYNAMLTSMVIDCPADFSNDTIRDLCRTKFIDIDIFDNPVDLVPVGDQNSGKVYRNRFCAECNGVDEIGRVLWLLSVVCEFGKSLLLESLEDASNLLQKEEKCNIAFVSPTHFTYSPEYGDFCSGVLAVCNEMGLWVNYNATTEAYCRSYFSMYKDFKNIHCYLCNGFYESQITTFCPSGYPKSLGYDSLAELNTVTHSLLESDANILGKSLMRREKGEGIACRQGAYYDKYKKHCRPLLCSPKMMLKAGWCEPVHTIAYGAQYTADFRIVPDVNNPLPITEVRQQVMASLTDTLSSLSDEQYTVEMLLKLNVSFRVLSKADLVDQNIEYIAVRVIFKPWDMFNGGTAMKDFTSLWPVLNSLRETKYFLYQNYTFELAMFNTSLFDTGSTRYMNGRFEESIDDEFGTVVNARLSFESNSDGKTWLVLKPLRQLYHGREGIGPFMPVTPLQFCPKIKLESMEYVRVNTGVSVNGLSRVLKLSEVVFDYTSSEEGLLTCASTYFASLIVEKIGSFDELAPSEFLTQMVLLSLSLIPLMATIITQCCFGPCRTVQGVIAVCLVFMFSSSQLLQIVTLLLDTVQKSWLCNTLGTLLHLTRLSVAALPAVGVLQFVYGGRRGMEERYRITSETNGGCWVWLMLGEVIAVAVVAIYVAVSVTSDSVETGGQPFLGYHGNQCLMYPKQMIAYSFAVPMYVMLCCTLFGYLYFMQSQKVTRSVCSISILRVYIFLTVLDGLSWMLYFLRLFSDMHAGSYAFAFLQLLLAFVMMTNFAVRSRMRKMFYQPAEVQGASIPRSEASDPGISMIAENNPGQTENGEDNGQCPSKSLSESVEGSQCDTNSGPTVEQDVKL